VGEVLGLLCVQRTTSRRLRSSGLPPYRLTLRPYEQMCPTRLVQPDTMFGQRAVIDICPVSRAVEPTVQHCLGGGISPCNVLGSAGVLYARILKAIERRLSIGIGVIEVISIDHVFAVLLCDLCYIVVPGQTGTTYRVAVVVHDLNEKNEFGIGIGVGSEPGICVAGEN